MQELQLRQRVAFVLVVCPAALCLQWRGEMEKRFGQNFEIMDRDLIARRRRERGFGVNVWSTHNRFIVSYQTLRRPEYREPLLAQLGTRLKKSLLVLDEAHTAAPASASMYAVDSNITYMIRDEIGPRFENRLFLSATPHNGHSNSFSALMAMLDPQRFTPGVPIAAGSKSLSAVMVRRLKRDLQALGKSDFPSREDRLRYSATECFDTFPFPAPDPRTVFPSLESIGETLYEFRAKLMIDTNQGLTKTYNALKDPACQDERILHLRKLHEDLDRAVLETYGWKEITVPPYCALSDEDRAALQAFEDEVIDKLFVLNAERAEAEKKAAAALAPAAKAPRKTAAKTPPSADSEAAPKKGRPRKGNDQGNLGF